MGATNGLANGFFAESYQMRMKWFRRNVPDAGPLYGAILFLSKLRAFFLGFAIHLRQDSGIQIALIERGFAAADYSGDDAWKCFYTAYCAHRIGVAHGDRPDLQREFGSSSERVVSLPAARNVLQ